MTDLATVLQVEPITEFEIKRSEGISEKMKKKCLVLLVGFNTMYCEGPSWGSESSSAACPSMVPG